MKKLLINISNALLIICCIMLVVSCQDKEEPKFDYIESSVTTGELDVALQNYTKSYYEGINDYKEGEYAGNIKNNQALADDPIVNFIPREYFTTSGKYNYFDINYGYYISTKQLDENTYSSTVIMLDVLYDYSLHITIGIRPLFSIEYRTVSVNEKCGSITAIGDDTTNNVVIPHKTSNLKITNLEITTEMKSAYMLNAGDEGYNEEVDYGPFLIEFFSVICKNSNYFDIFTFSDEDLNKSIKSQYYYKKGNEYLSYDNLEYYDYHENSGVLALYNNHSEQLESYGQLIKGIKCKYYDKDGQNAVMDINKNNQMTKLVFSIKEATYSLSILDMNISFDILEDNEIIDNVNSNFTATYYYDGELSLDTTMLWPCWNDNSQVYVIKPKTSGNYIIKAQRYDNDTLSEIDVNYRINEVINNQTLEEIDDLDGVFYMEKDKEYIVRILSSKSTRGYDTYISLENVE